MLRLILGSAGSGKTSMITREIAEKVASETGGVCMIVPEQYSFEAERELCDTCGDKLSLYAEVFSFSRLATRAAAKTGGVFLDAGGRLLCMCLAVKQVSPSLRFFKAAERSARLQLEILKTVDELRNARVGFDALFSAAESLGGELAQKLYDLALCLEAYETQLARGHADPAGRLAHLADAIFSGEQKFGHVYIDGFTDFTDSEMRVIEALISSGVPVTVCLTCGRLTDDSEHFEPSRAAAGALGRYAETLGQRTETVYTEEKSDKNAALRFYEDHLFRYTSESMEDTSGALSIFRAASPHEECEIAAAQCLYLVREKGCRWRDIAIAARGFDDYGARLEDVFSLYGVPLFYARRESIMQKPAPSLIAAAFEVVLGGWDLPDMLDYLKTGLTGLDRAECDKLECYAVLWGIRGSAWHKSKAWKQHPKGFGAAETEGSSLLLSEINSLRLRLAMPLLRLAENGRRAVTAIEQTRALSDFLQDIRLPETLQGQAARLERAGRAQLADEFSQLWGIICRALEQFSALLGETPMGQEEFSELFLKTLSQYDVSSIPVSPDTVTAGEIDRMRRRRIKHLIIIGASDDRLPGVSEGTGLLTEDDRSELERLGIFRAGTSDKLPREFSLIYNCVTLPSETLTLTFGAAGGEGAKTRPSFLISRARLLLNAQVNDADTDALRLSSGGSGFLLASRYLKSRDRAARLAYEFFSSTPEGRGRLKRLASRADFGRGSVSEKSAEMLYGSSPRISPSRADAFFSCKFHYFLRYGLKLSDKEKAGFDPPELGTFMHYVLERCAQEISESVGFRNLPQGLASELADKYTDMYAAERLGGFEGKSPRFIFLFNRLRPSVKRVVEDMASELARSDFMPLRFELSFSPEGDLPPIRLSDGENELFVSGTADRVDGYLCNGKLYLRVVDYKTGKKSFSLSDVWYGMGMQMLLYLFSLERAGASLFGAEIVPAGVLYVPARDGIIVSQRDLPDEELSAAKANAHRRSGLLLNDGSILRAMEHGEEPEYMPLKYKNGEITPSDSLADKEQLAALREHVDRRLLELASGISEGKIDAEPCYRSESDNACRFCPYSRVCRFDEARDRRMYMGKMNAGEFWKRVGGEPHEQN